jgi:hypothetical protein
MKILQFGNRGEEFFRRRFSLGREKLKAEAGPLLVQNVGDMHFSFNRAKGSGQ